MYLAVKLIQIEAIIRWLITAIVHEGRELFFTQINLQHAFKQSPSAHACFESCTHWSMDVLSRAPIGQWMR